MCLLSAVQQLHVLVLYLDWSGEHYLDDRYPFDEETERRVDVEHESNEEPSLTGVVMKNAIMGVTVIFIIKESTTVPCAMLYHVHLVLLMDRDVLKRIAWLGSVANESIAPNI